MKRRSSAGTEQLCCSSVAAVAPGSVAPLLHLCCTSVAAVAAGSVAPLLQLLHELRRHRASDDSLYLLYQYKSTQCTSFAGTKVQILMPTGTERATTQRSRLLDAN